VAVGATAGAGAGGLAGGTGAVAFVTCATEPGAACRVTTFGVAAFRARLRPGAVDLGTEVNLDSAVGANRAAVRLVGSDACTTVDDAPAAALGACERSGLIASSQTEATTEPETAAEAATALSTREKLGLMECTLPPDNQYGICIGRPRRFLNSPMEVRS